LIKSYSRDVIPGLECEKVRSIDGSYLAFYDDEMPKWKVIPTKTKGRFSLYHLNQRGDYGWHFQEVVGRLPDVLFQIAMHEAFERRLIKPNDKKYINWNLNDMVKLLRGKVKEV
jgi:hypothetical protein